MDRDEVLEILRDRKPILMKRFGVDRIGIFGSVARNEAHSDSDVDVVVEMKPNLFGRVELKADLESRLGKPVDVVRYRQKMPPRLKDRIDREAIYV